MENHTNHTPPSRTSDELALIDAFLAGECADAEVARARALLRACPAPAVAVDVMTADDLPLASGDLRRAWTGVARRIGLAGYRSAEQGTAPMQAAGPRAFPSRTVLPVGMRPGSTRLVRRIAMAAAGCAAAVTVAWLGVRHTGRGSTPDADQAAVPTRVIAARPGQRTTWTLDDGTRVVLNAGTTLRVPRDLRRSRTVALDGEALFTVTHRADVPFVVRAGAARVTVLGTEFVVRRYSEDHRVRVVVAEGRVALGASSARRGSTRDVVLGPRTLGEVSDSGETVVKPNVDANPYTDWTRGRLVFKNTPLREAFPALERRYGLTIHLTDTTLANQRLSVTVTDDGASSVLDAISLVFGVRYVRDGDVVTFLPPRAPVSQARRQPFPPRTEVSHGR